MSRVDDRYDEAQAAVERDFPESWRPEPGDVLVGEFVRLDRSTTEYGPQDIVVLRDREGVDHGVWLLHSVAREQFKRARPEVGEIVAVRYIGKRKSGEGRSYHDWRVSVAGRSNTEIGWDELDAEAPATSTGHARALEPSHRRLFVLRRCPLRRCRRATPRPGT